MIENILSTTRQKQKIKNHSDELVKQRVFTALPAFAEVVLTECRGFVMCDFSASRKIAC